MVREEEGVLRRYVHFATGNYNDRTARLYEDLGVLSCDEKLGATVASVFNELTAGVPAPDYGDLLVAPHNLRQRFRKLVQIVVHFSCFHVYIYDVYGMVGVTPSRNIERVSSRETPYS